MIFIIDQAFSSSDTKSNKTIKINKEALSGNNTRTAETGSIHTHTGDGSTGLVDRFQ